MRPLAPRLQVIHDMVRPVGVAADIGCENGALGVALVLSGRCQQLIASDISLSSVEAAKATVRRLLSPRHASAVHVRLGDGLDALAPHEHVDVITMAGIALPRMQRILLHPRILLAAGGGSATSPRRVQTLLLQPLQPRIDRLTGLYARLWSSGYAVREERFLSGAASRGLPSLTVRAELRSGPSTPAKGVAGESAAAEGAAAEGTAVLGRVVADDEAACPAM